MKFGITVFGQYPRDDDMRARFAELMATVRHAEHCGWDFVSKGMHYSADPLQSVQQIPFLARVSAEAPRLAINTGVALLPLHKPLDLAEQLATLDVMSGGRLIFGAGLGYREVEFKAFGTSMRERVARFEEALAAILRLWRGERVTMRGSHFELDGAVCSPLPLQRPHPPVWIGGSVPAAIRRAARLADAWDVEPFLPLPEIARLLDVFRREREAAGRAPAQDFVVRRVVFVARTREEAVRLARPHLETKFAAYSSWGRGDALPTGREGLHDRFDDLARDRFAIGSPAEVVEELDRYRRTVGATHIVTSFLWPGLPPALAHDTMSLIGAEVLPHLR